MVYNYKLSEICKKFEGNLISASYDEDSEKIGLACDDVILLENDEVIDLLNNYGKVIKQLTIRVKPSMCDKELLSKIISFKEKFPNYNTKISVANDLDVKYEIYKDGKRDFNTSCYYFDIELFEKWYELIQKTDYRGSYKIYTSSNDNIEDSIKIGEIFLRDVTELDMDDFLARFNKNEIDDNFVITMPNRELAHSGEYDIYDLQTFKQIMEKLHEITDDIDPSLPDLKKFAIIYERIGRFIDYDFSTLNDKITDENYRKCRNLENGLLKGKCICEGYAEILLNALRMVGIKNYMVTGKFLLKNKDIQIEGFKEVKNQDGEIVAYKGKDAEGNEITYVKEKNGFWSEVRNYGGKMGEAGHAWNKIFIDGQVFYADITNDSQFIKADICFVCIQSKEEMEAKGYFPFNQDEEAKGLSPEKKEELRTYQYEIAYKRYVKKEIEYARKKFGPGNFIDCYIIMNRARGDFVFNREILEMLIQEYSLEGVKKACQKINNPRFESRINELLEQIFKESNKESEDKSLVNNKAETKRPDKLPYSHKRIAQGVMDSKVNAEQLKIASIKEIKDDNIH